MLPWPGMQRWRGGGRAGRDGEGGRACALGLQLRACCSQLRFVSVLKALNQLGGIGCK